MFRAIIIIIIIIIIIKCACFILLARRTYQYWNLGDGWYFYVFVIIIWEAKTCILLFFIMLWLLQPTTLP